MSTFCMWYKKMGPAWFFYVWVLSCPSTICWKDCTFPHWIILASHLKMTIKCEGFSRLNSSLLPYLSSCQYVYCIVKSSSLEEWILQLCSFFKIVFISLSPLNFHVNFWSSLSFSSEKPDCFELADQLGSIASYLLWSVYCHFHLHSWSLGFSIMFCSFQKISLVILLLNSLLSNSFSLMLHKWHCFLNFIFRLEMQLIFAYLFCTLQTCWTHLLTYKIYYRKFPTYDCSIWVFNFAVVQKQSSRNYIYSFEFWSFPRLAIFTRKLVMLGSSNSKPAAPRQPLGLEGKQPMQTYLFIVLWRYFVFYKL